MKKLEQFRMLGLSENTLHALEKKGFEEPTPIQQKTIPILLKGEVDIIGQAQTGTGKTAAFGLPILEGIQEKLKTVQALILVPTRELAIQVSEELNSLKGEKNLQIVPIYGGQSMEEQLRRLRKGIDVVVGTPGRIL
ncbi:MAG: DEAD/DEAH box helicase, partial [Candidatus Brocadia sp.]